MASAWANSYEKQVKRNLKYQELVQRKIEAHKTKQALIDLRKDWIRNQKINHRNEYQRLIGDLNNSMLPGHTVENIKNRMKHLENISNESLGKVGMGKGQTLDYNALMARLSR